MKKVLHLFLGAVIGAAVGAVAAGKIIIKGMDRYRVQSDKNYALFMLMNKWMEANREGRHVKGYLERYDYKTVAVYGLSHVGKCLLEELKDCDVEIKYAVDINATAVYPGIETYYPGDDLPTVDLMIVTSVGNFDEIYSNLKDKVKCPIISLENILCSSGSEV